MPLFKDKIIFYKMSCCAAKKSTKACDLRQQGTKQGGGIREDTLGKYFSVPKIPGL